jgi:hypothetical protein
MIKQYLQMDISLNKTLIIVFAALIWQCCHSQSGGAQIEAKPMSTDTLPSTQNGIVYFSTDNGLNWINASSGLPENTRIGLGGIATSSDCIGLATKDNGVYLYDFTKKMWAHVSTDQEIIAANVGAMAIKDSIIFVGTQYKGVFYKHLTGRNWKNINEGLGNTTIRRFCKFNDTLYVCTNDGFYALNKFTDKWRMIFGQPSLQTNGATLYNGSFYLATNKGIFSQQKDKTWVNTAPQFNLHNINSDHSHIYAMTYNELLMSSSDGKTWQSLQNGLPPTLYTFDVLYHNNSIFAAQWDGIYTKTIGSSKWDLSSRGLSEKFAITNLKAYHDILVIGTSERKLKTTMEMPK